MQSGCVNVCGHTAHLERISFRGEFWSNLLLIYVSHAHTPQRTYLAAERLEDGVVRRVGSPHRFHHLLRQPERRRHELGVLAEQVPIAPMRCDAIRSNPWTSQNRRANTNIQFGVKTRGKYKRDSTKEAHSTSTSNIASKPLNTEHGTRPTMDATLFRTKQALEKKSRKRIVSYRMIPA